MDDPALYDVDPVRPGAAPALNVPAVGFPDICKVRPIWLRTTEALTRWLAYHFSDAARIEHPQLTRYVWSAVPTATNIVISSLAEWKPTQSQNRPALLVDRLDQDKDMQARGIGDQLQGMRQENYAHFIRGRHVVHCLGGAEAEADNLAWEVWRELVRFAPVARDRLGLMRFLPTKVGRRTQLLEHKTVYTVPVVCEYGFGEQWRVTSLDEAEVTAILTTFDLGPAS